jgi:uncharacterized protein YcaQ
MVNPTTVYPLAAVRALALHAQGLTTLPGAEPPPTPDAIYAMIDRLGCVQLDTLQMVQRSQYLVLWSRLGRYDPADLDRLLYDPQAIARGQNNRRVFEYWMHAACLIPLTEYRYRIGMMRWFAEGKSHWGSAWASKSSNVELKNAVLERIRCEGPLRAADFEHTGERRGTWWDWKPAKHALEGLYNAGELMIAGRIKFQRLYDLRERVLPAWVDVSEPTPAETDRHHLERAVRALGICQPVQAADYAYMKRTKAKPVVDELIAAGDFVPVSATLSDGQARPLIVHRDALPQLEAAADGAAPPCRTTFLSPFDSLFWARGRDVQLWNFRQALEAYKPAPQREWGYFCLPILHHDCLVGRFDPKLERRARTLRLKALYLEPDVAPGEELVAGVAGALRDFMAFHGAESLVIERSQPAELSEKLLAAV